MTSVLKSIIFGVSTAALFGGIAMTLTYAGALKEIVRIAAGIMVILSLLRPISKVQFRLPAQWMRASTEPITRQVEEATVQRKDWMAVSSAKEISAYLGRKAKDMGITCKIEVQASMKEDDTVSLDGARIYGRLSAEELDWITALLETECGITREVQTYVEN